MNATAPERRPSCPPVTTLLTALLMMVSLGSLLAGCVEEPLPQRRSSHGDCLLNLRVSRLEEALQRCNKVVAAFPRDPVPLNDRFLIHSLAGDNPAACADIRRASALARQRPAADLDPLLRKDLAQRLESCRD